MKTKILLPTLALLLAPLAGAEEITLASFSGAVPQSYGWQVVGGLPLNVIDDDGQKAVEFKDDSETDFAALVYRLTEEQAIEMVSKGCTVVARVRHVGNGPTGANFRLLLRIPGYGSAQLLFYHNTGEDMMYLNSYDSVREVAEGAPLPDSGQSYVTVKGVFRPGAEPELPGSLEVFFNDGPVLLLGLARKASAHAQVEIGGIGGSAMGRTNHTLVSEFRLTTP